MTHFRLSPEAAQDIIDIYEFIAQDSVDAAEQVRNEVFEAIAGLVAFPGKGHRREDLTSQPVLFIPDYLPPWMDTPRDCGGSARQAQHQEDLAEEVTTIPRWPSTMRLEAYRPEPLPLSLLNDFLYCPRRAGLKVIEGWWGDNEHTTKGELAHDHTDLPGYEVAKGVKLLRALPVFSERLGLSGKCDIVEQNSDGSLCPVEYKKGKRRRFENDDAQLCAQALCLEEMFGKPIVCGPFFTRRASAGAK